MTAKDRDTGAKPRTRRPLIQTVGGRTLKARPVIGWREWIALPDLGITGVKAKVDTGARTSSLHVYNTEEFQRGGQDWVRFDVHPLQRSTREKIRVEVPVLTSRRVRSSTGHAEQRLVIETQAVLGPQSWPIQITLASRDAMGFRMLLGRRALRSRFLVDPSRSFLGGTAEDG